MESCGTDVHRQSYAARYIPAVTPDPHPSSEPLQPPPEPGISTAAQRTADGPIASAAAVIDLLGGLAFGELTAFDRLAQDSRLAPTLAGRAALAGMAAAEIGHFQQLCGRLEAMGASPAAAMEPFRASVNAFHDSTAPSSWLEGLVKAYVGDGIAADFYREVADFVDESTRQLVLGVLEDTGHAEFAVREVRAAIEATPSISGRLSLWARRLVGEAISQAQHVVAERDPLTDLLVAGTGDLSGVSALIKRLTTAHATRMSALGLSN